MNYLKMKKKSHREHRERRDELKSILFSFYKLFSMVKKSCKTILISTLLIFLIINDLSGNNTQNPEGTLIVIDKAQNSVVIGFNVTLENTVITFKNLKIFVRDNTNKSRNNLTSLIHALTKLGATSEDIVSILSILHKAGSLNGKLVVI